MVFSAHLHCACFFLQAPVGGERQSSGVGGEGEQREEAAEPQQRGAAVAPADGRAEPPHVTLRLAKPPRRHRRLLPSLGRNTPIHLLAWPREPRPRLFTRARHPQPRHPHPPGPASLWTRQSGP